MSCDITRCSDSKNIYDFPSEERSERFLDALENTKGNTEDSLRRERIFKDLFCIN